MTHEEAKNLKYKHSVHRPNPSNIVVFNIAKNLYTSHHRLLASPHGADIAQALRSLDVEKLDPALKAELKKKFA